MLVLFMGKSRTSCRFLHSTWAGPHECSLGNPHPELKGGTKSCISSGLEQSSFNRRGVLPETTTFPKLGFSPAYVRCQKLWVVSG
jgi:hypothetical protein